MKTAGNVALGIFLAFLIPTLMLLLLGWGQYLCRVLDLK